MLRQPLVNAAGQKADDGQMLEQHPLLLGWSACPEAPGSPADTRLGAARRMPPDFPLAASIDSHFSPSPSRKPQDPAFSDSPACQPLSARLSAPFPPAAAESRRNLPGRDHRQTRQHRLQPALDVITGRTWTKKHGEGRSGGSADKLPHRIGEAADHGVPGASARPAGAARLGQRGQNLLFERRIEQQHRQLALAVEQRPDQPPSQRLARGLDQRHQASCSPARSRAAPRESRPGRGSRPARAAAARAPGRPRPASAAWAPALPSAWDGSH
jgi:hypothetical protein